MLYSPHESLPSLYAQLANSSALMIAAISSMQNKSITRDDSTFVVLSVASPVMFYIWICSLLPRGILMLDAFAAQSANISAGQRHAIRFISLSNFALWLVALAYTLAPTTQFSQPECDKSLSLDDYFNLFSLFQLVLGLFTWIVCLWFVMRTKRRFEILSQNDCELGRCVVDGLIAIFAIRGS